MAKEDTIRKVIGLSERIKEVGAGYFHSNPLSDSQTILGEKVHFSLFDWGLIGAISESPVVIHGDTDRGKTDLARIIMTSLFGKEEEGWHKTNVDLDFGSMTYSGTDFSALHDGATSEELFFAKDFISYPGLIWDEPNRAPPKLINKLLHILEKDFHLENGEKILSGRDYGGGRYQYHFLAMNDDNRNFHGTFEVDRALRRRQTIEIPIDLFQTTMSDKRRMGSERMGDLDIHNGETHFEDIVQVLESLGEIPVSPEAEHMKLYLQSMVFCKNSMTGTKKGIDFNQGICEKSSTAAGRIMEDNESREVDIGSCHYLAAYPNKMCPSVMGVTDGVSIRFGTIARAHAVMRAAKTLETIARKIGAQKEKASDMKQAARNFVLGEFYGKIEEYIGIDEERYSRDDLVKLFIEKYISELKVEACDFRAVLPFIGYSKMEIDDAWVSKNYQGSRWHAINSIAEIAYQNITRFHTENSDAFRELLDNGEVILEDRTRYDEALHDDYWLDKSLDAYRKSPEAKSPVSAEQVLRLLE